MTENEKYLEWKEYVRDEELSSDLDRVNGNEEEIFDRFYRSLEFGTAGLRGVLGAGTNRMNIYTVRQATQGLAEYLNGKKSGASVAIAYDTRHNSEKFAKEAACVLVANGIKVWLYDAPAPTPMLSYAVRERYCDAGIVVTASHNPAKYNGYKVYGADGCQISPEVAKEILAVIDKTDVLRGALTCNYDSAVSEKKITLIPESFWRRFYARVLKEGVDRENHSKNTLSVVYTPLNGTGAIPVVTTLSLAGFGNIEMVREQEKPDGAFPTCPFPNPELREALALALKQAEASGADLVLATDPDADRVGIASREKDGFRLFTGNEVGALLLDFIASAREENGTMPENPVAVRSLVSTKLADAVAAGHGIEMKSVFTGFRFIGKVIAELEAIEQPERFIFGFEESCGYLSGTYVRDKDAVDASLLICEAANFWKLRGKTLGEALADIQAKYGYYHDFQDNFYCEGADGAKRIAGIMASLREKAPESVCGKAVVSAKDYKPDANMIEYTLEGGSSFIVRPSGTEPKLKIYYSVKSTDFEAAKAEGEAIKAEVTALLGF
ncbi:MAG: phospho-sugar mutase [Oscillospiraceae bacterium]|nr:phospho-sugar mutase [Oscillospiraceae bacterium]